LGVRHACVDVNEPATVRTVGLRELIPAADLHRRVGELAAEVARAYEGLRPVLVSVLKGATLFLADLVRAAGIDVEVDFMSISSYGSPNATSGVVRIEKDLEASIEGRHVLVIEDIVDTGLTLNYLLRVLAARRPASLRVCTLLDKDVRRIVELPIDFRGFAIPDEFVIGYGLDFDERYRNVDGIWAVDDVRKLESDPEVFVPVFFGE
jgi:hypoxanthine phosphoribosyltransferase